MLGEIDPLQNEMLARDENRSGTGKASWTASSLNRPGIGNGYSVVLVQLALSAIVEQAECRVAALLNLREHNAGAYGVDRASRDEEDVAF